jgi:Tol biopolymer transport system component
MEWALDDTILFSIDSSPGLRRISAAGGEAEQLTTVDDTAGESQHGNATLLPDGDTVLFSILSAGEEPRLARLSLATREVTRFTIVGSDPWFVPTGHVVYVVSDGTLRALPFDLDRSEFTSSNPVPVLENLHAGNGGFTGNFGLAANGSLVYLTGNSSIGTATLAWVDRGGLQEPLDLESSDYASPRVSPDGSLVAVSLTSPDSSGRDIYIYDLERQTPTRLTFDAADDFYPLWSEDGASVVFGSDREGGGIFRRAADGTGQVEQLTTGTAVPFSYSQDGTILIFGTTEPGTRDDLHVLSIGSDEPPEPLLQTQFDEEHGALSPDGRWLAYTSDESGGEEIFVRSFPNLDDTKLQISTGGAREPVWGPDGDELFYRSPNGMMTVQIETEPALRAGIPEVLFEEVSLPTVGGGVRYDLSPDGQRLLMVMPSAASGDVPVSQIVLIQNWFEELTERVPVP